MFEVFGFYKFVKVKSLKKNKSEIELGTVSAVASGATGYGVTKAGITKAGIGLAASRGKGKFWAVPAAGTIGALVGCQIDGG